MKKAILSRFVTVVLLALLLSSVVSYYAMAQEMLTQNISHMKNLLRVIDATADFSGDIQEEMDRLERSMDERLRITVIDSEGKVWADTDTTTTGLENHLEREEIRQALEGGFGYATRFSQTIGEGTPWHTKSTVNKFSYSFRR